MHMHIPAVALQLSEVCLPDSHTVRQVRYLGSYLASSGSRSMASKGPGNLPKVTPTGPVWHVPGQYSKLDKGDVCC